MSHFVTPEGEQEGQPKGSAAGPSGLRLGSALIERTANAVAAEVRRHALEIERGAAARKAYLSQLRESFAITDGRSPNLSFLDRPSVRANAPADAAGEPVQGLPPRRRPLGVR